MMAKTENTIRATAAHHPLLPPDAVTHFDPIAIERSCAQLEVLRRRDFWCDPIRSLDELKANHQRYLELDELDPPKLCGLGSAQDIAALRNTARPPAGAIVLDNVTHVDARVVVVRCTDNRCSSPNVELNLAPHEVCEVVSAGHVLDEKDIESIAIGVALKKANVILVQSHGGVCGAIKLALAEKDHAGKTQHDVTRKIGGGLGSMETVDPPHIFTGTLEHLDRTLERILDPAVSLKLLADYTGEASFARLFELGRCVVVGVYVDFEVYQSAARNQIVLLKRLSFFDRIGSLARFISEKHRAYYRTAANQQH